MDMAWCCIQPCRDNWDPFKAIGNLLIVRDTYTKQKCLIVCRVQLLSVLHVRRKVTWREIVLTVDCHHFLPCRGQTSNISECSVTFFIPYHVSIWLLEWSYLVVELLVLSWNACSWLLHYFHGHHIAGDFEPSDHEIRDRQRVLSELLAIIRTTYPGMCVNASYILVSQHYWLLIVIDIISRLFVTS